MSGHTHATFEEVLTAFKEAEAAPPSQRGQAFSALRSALDRLPVKRRRGSQWDDPVRRAATVAKMAQAQQRRRQRDGARAPRFVLERPRTGDEGRQVCNAQEAAVELGITVKAFMNLVYTKKHQSFIHRNKRHYISVTPVTDDEVGK